MPSTKKEHKKKEEFMSIMSTMSKNEKDTSVQHFGKSSKKKNRNSTKNKRRSCCTATVTATATAITISSIIATCTSIRILNPSIIPVADAFIHQHHHPYQHYQRTQKRTPAFIVTPSSHFNFVISSQSNSRYHSPISSSISNISNISSTNRNSISISNSNSNRNSCILNMSPSQYLEYKKPPISSSSSSSDTNTSSPSTKKNIINFYDLEELVAPKPTYKINLEAQDSSKTSSIMKRNIVNLLKDDDGEEDECIPDYSEEAANEIADKMTYSRISEEAKAKANYAVQKIEKNDSSSKNKKNKMKKKKKKTDGDSDVLNTSSSILQNGQSQNMPSTNNNDLFFDNNNNEEEEEKNHEQQRIEQLKKKRRFTASVKETGVDTMSQYVKSMGSHELLPKESEVLLGKQIQILVQWESVRQELEEKLSRYDMI